MTDPLDRSPEADASGLRPCSTRPPYRGERPMITTMTNANDRVRIVVAGYVRQSLDATGEGLAVARQREDIARLCEELGWEVRWYPDNSVSATKRKPRPMYEQMLADIRSGLVRGVVVWDLDRLHRRPVELEEFIDLADRYGLLLRTVTGDVDLSTDGGRLFARIKGAVARAEMERKASRQRRAHQQRAEKGLPWNVRRAFGYEADGVTPDPVEAPLVASAFDGMLAGETIYGIAARWNGAGKTTPRGAEWTPAGVRHVLLNPRYKGVCRYRTTERGAVVEIDSVAVWPALVDAATFDAVGSMFRRRSEQVGTAGSPTARRFLLSGILRCSICSKGLRTSTTGGRRAYRCPAGCVHVQAAPVDAWVREAVSVRLSRDDAPDLLLDAGREDAAELTRARLRTEASIEALAAERDDPDMGMSGAEYVRRRKALVARLREIDEASQHASREPILGDLVRGTKSWADLPLDQQRAVVSTLFETLEVRPNSVRGRRFVRSERLDYAWAA